MPELTEISKHIMFEETKQGLNLEIVDQDGRSMFADGSKVPYDRTRRLIQKLAAPLKATPLRVSIAGHTAAGFVPTRSDYGAFDLSADRANAVRQILEREGLAAVHIFAVVRQGRQPAAVSRRSDAAGQPPRDHHLDARRPAAAARPEAVICALLYYRHNAALVRSAFGCAPAMPRCYGRRLTGNRGSVDSRPDQINRKSVFPHHDCQRHLHRSP